MPLIFTQPDIDETKIDRTKWTQTGWLVVDLPEKGQVPAYLVEALRVLANDLMKQNGYHEVQFTGIRFTATRYETKEGSDESRA